MGNDFNPVPARKDPAGVRKAVIPPDYDGPVISRDDSRERFQKREDVRRVVINMHCEKKYGGPMICKPQRLWRYSDEDANTALHIARMKLMGRDVKFIPIEEEDESLFPIKIASTLIGVMGWEGFLGGGTAAGGSAAAGGAATGGAAAGGSAGSAVGWSFVIVKGGLLIVSGAAVFGPSQATWNDRHQLIEFGVEDSFDQPVEVVVNPARASDSDVLRDREEGEDLHVTPDPGVSGREVDTASPQPPNDPFNSGGKAKLGQNEATWSDIWNGLKEWWGKKGERWKIVKEKVPEWIRNRFNRRGRDKDDPPITATTLRGKLRQGTQQWWRKQVDHWRELWGKIRNVVKSVWNNPIVEIANAFNRPMIILWKVPKFLFGELYSYLSLAVSTIRYFIKSDNRKPLGASLVKRDHEWLLGYYGSTLIGTFLPHRVYNWGFGSSFIGAALWSVGEMIQQYQAGGAGRHDKDWNRINRTQSSSLLWGAMVIFYRVTNNVFPILEWEAWLVQAEKNPSFWTRFVPALRRIPGWLAPRRVPNWRNYATQLLSGNIYMNLICPLLADIEGADRGEYCKMLNARIWTTDLLPRWYALTWNAYQRPLHNLFVSAAGATQVGFFSEYFSVYEGFNFFRDSVASMVSEREHVDGALDTLKRSLGEKNFVGEDWTLNPGEWWDFFDDINSGYFTHEQIRYFAELVRKSRVKGARELIGKYDKRVIRTLRMVLATYAHSSIPHDWKADEINGNGMTGREIEEAHEEEILFRWKLQRYFLDQGFRPPIFKGKHDFVNMMEIINEGR